MSMVGHLRGQTFHSRKGAVANAFRHAVDYVLLDPETARGPALFSRNRGNLTALHDRDHGGLPGQRRGVAWLRDLLAERGLTRPAGQPLGATARAGPCLQPGRLLAGA